MWNEVRHVFNLVMIYNSRNEFFAFTKYRGARYDKMKEYRRTYKKDSTPEKPILTIQKVLQFKITTPGG